MSSTDTEDEEHSSAIKTPGQLITVVLAAFIFPVVTLLLVGRLVIGDIPADPDNPAFSEEAVAKRLAPVGKLVIAGDSSEDGMQPEGVGQTQGTVAPVAAAAPAAAAATSPAGGGSEGGPDQIKSIYTASCAACHATGAAGAPKLGDSAAWAPRIKAGNEALYSAAINGKNAMPPKGGNPSLSDADVKAVVDYMVSQSK